VIAYFGYDFSVGGMQYLEDIPWIADLGVTYAMGVDGISLPMMLLTTLSAFGGVRLLADRQPPEGILHPAADSNRWRHRHLHHQRPVHLPALLRACRHSDLHPCHYLGFEQTGQQGIRGYEAHITLLMGSAFMLVGVVMLYLNAYPEGSRTFSMEALAKAHELGNLPESFQVFAFLLMLIGFGRCCRCGRSTAGRRTVMPERLRPFR
jgi:NADH-quinone oxidoreductase subunit M